MVSIRAAVFALFVGSAFGQFPSPLIVAPPANTDPSCVRLYEQRTNGNNFLAVCAPNAITTTTSFSFPNLVGAQMATQNYANTFSGVTTLAASVVFSGTRNIGTAGAPGNDLIFTNIFMENQKICFPGSAYSSCWSTRVQPASSSKFEILNDLGVVFATFDRTLPRITMPAGGTIVAPGGFSTGTYGFDTSGTATLGQITWTGAFIQGANTRISTTGQGNFVGVLSSTSIQATNNVTATDHLVLGSNSSVLKRQVGFTTTTLIDASNNASFAALTLTGTTGSAQCLEADSSGVVAGTGSACGSGGGGGVTSLAATSPVTTTGATGAITIACATCATTGVGSSVSFLQVTSPDGTYDRLQFTNPGAGSDTGAGIIQRNAAGTIIFRVYYSGVIETGYSGVGNEPACFTTGGTIYRGAGGVC